MIIISDTDLLVQHKCVTHTYTNTYTQKHTPKDLSVVVFEAEIGCFWEFKSWICFKGIWDLEDIRFRNSSRLASGNSSHVKDSSCEWSTCISQLNRETINAHVAESCVAYRSSHAEAEHWSTHQACSMNYYSLCRLSSDPPAHMASNCFKKK